MNPFSLSQHIQTSQRLDYLTNTQQATVAQLKPQYIDNNVMDVDLDTPIYRLFNENRFFEMLEGKTLMLLHTKFWEDPFENFLLNARWETAQGQQVDVSSVRDSYYGQCWTLREECDGLWRNYRGISANPAAPAAAIKVATTVGKLMDQFYDVNNKFHEHAYFLGKVNYCTDAEVNAYFTQPEAMNSVAHQTNIRYPKTMLVKRKAFSYEEEVRLIFSDSSGSAARRANPSNGLHPLAIDPNTLFDYIELDPLMKAPAATAAQARIAAAGYTGRITQSTLYTNPSFVVRLA